MRHIWTLSLAPVAFVFTMLVCSAICISGLVDRTGWAWWRIARLWGWGMMRMGGVTGKIRHRHLERMTGLHSAILMANHESNLDPALLIGLSEAPVSIVSKHSLFYVPILGQAMWVVGMISVNRGRSDRAIQSLQAAADQIRAGRVVLVFPEGTRSHSRELLKFKKGGFMLALQAGVPIVPIGIAGTQRVLPPGLGAIRFGPVAVSVGEPISTEGLDISDRAWIMEQVEAAILAQRRQAEQMLQD
jgi:1-acyl-sn-glycerol-3-phosphate acyltransferase